LSSSKIEIRRLVRDRACGVLVDVQDFFLRALPPAERTRIKETTAQFLGLLTHLGCPVVATIERPVEEKGTLPQTLLLYAKTPPIVLEKEFFDLTAEPRALERVASLGRDQVVLAGSETDVCVLQSCLGLLEKGYEVFVVEDLVFSSSGETDAAIGRMRDAGAVIVTYKTLFHEFLRSVEGSAARRALEGTEFPKALNEYAF
jgi:nicotinamidase-related amidase